jgi:hypothetical protein
MPFRQDLNSHLYRAREADPEPPISSRHDSSGVLQSPLAYRVVTSEGESRSFFRFALDYGGLRGSITPK